jgi:hypothetical protein
MKKVDRVIHSTSINKLEHLVSNDHIAVDPERNMGPRCLMLIAF